jgi:uncharacterized protein YgiM (DUF1202 family)
VCVVNADVLHLRTGPGVEYSVIGWLYSGEAVTIITPGAWLEVRTSSGAVGFVNGEYCE